MQEMTEAHRFSLASVETHSDDGRVSIEPAIVVAGAYHPLSAFSSQYTSVLAVLADWNNALPFLKDCAKQVHANEQSNASTNNTKLTSPTVLAPVLYPSKLVAVGANYSSHLAEMSLPVEKWEPMPFFLRPPTTCMVGPGKTVIIPPSTKKFDWECELAVVVGKTLRRASREEAKAGIAGYTIGLDMSCRDLIPAKRGLGTDLVRGKAQDTMAPCGPHIVPAEFVGDKIDDLRIVLDVNEQKMMDASTNEMIYKCDEILSIVSEFITLEPGDIVLTGSPAGSAGSHGDRWLKAGDVIRAEIEGIGVLKVEMQN